MPNLSGKIAAARLLKQRLDVLIVGAKVKPNAQARVLTTLFLSVSEQFAAVLCLVENGFSSHAPVMVRSMLEGFSDLLNVANDASYLDQMEFDNARSDVRLFEEYGADPTIKQDKEAVAKLTEWTDRARPVRDNLASRGFRPVSVVEKFKRAKIFESYVAYRVFCSFAHNQLTTLRSRHEGEFELRYHASAPEAMIVSTLTIAVSILGNAARALERFAEVPSADLEKIIDAVEDAWAKAE